MMLGLLALVYVAAATESGPMAVPIPMHQVGTNEPVTGVCWNVASGAEYTHTFGGLNELAVTFHFVGAVVGRPRDIVLCAGSHCRANHKEGHSFWSAPLGLGNATAVIVRVAGPSSGCIDQMAQLSSLRRPRSAGRLGARQHLSLPCATNTDDTIAAKCSAAGSCNPMPAVYDRAAATASIMFQKNGGWFVCTSWASSTTGHMFTNNHCISTQDVADTVEFFFGCEMSCNYDSVTCDYNSALTGSSKCSRCDLSTAYNTACYSQMSGPTASGATLLRTSATYDYTLLRVKTPANVPCFADPNCPMRLVPSNYLVGRPNVFMFHHSAGDPKLLSYFDSPSPGHLTTGRLQIRGVSGGCYVGDLAYDADVVGGSSGSVVALAPDYCSPTNGQR
jgi:hypothetical protein